MPNESLPAAALAPAEPSALLRLRNILDSLGALVVVLSADGRITDLSRSVAEPTGLPREELLGRPFLEMSWWTDSSENRQRLAAAIERAIVGETTRFEATLRRIGNGDLMDLELTVAPLRESAGERLEIVVSGVDLTARKVAERERARSEARLAEAQRVSHVGSWEWEVAENRITWSDELYRIYGESPETFGASYEAFLAKIHPEDLELTKNVVLAALGTLSPFVYDHRVVRKDGAVRMLHTRGEVVAGGDGRPARLVGSCWDVTDRWEETRVLERTVSLLRATLESAADGILAVDLDGKPSDWNERLLEIWKLPRGIMDARDGAAMVRFAGEQVAEPADFVHQVLDLYGRPEDEAKQVLRLRDGRVLERYSRPQRVGDRVIGRVCTYRDVTALEELLRRNEEARAEADRARRTMENMLEQISDGFVALDNDWKYVFANTSGARMLGRTPETLIGRHIWTEFPEGKDKPFAVAYSRAVVEQSVLRIREYYEPWGRWFENRIYPSADGLAILFTDVTAEETAAEKLRASHAELRALAARLDEIREEERRLLARELHDQVGQALTGLQLDFACLERVVDLRDPAAAEHASRMKRLLVETLTLVRRLSSDLHPAILDDLGLPAALASLSQELEARSGLRVRLSLPHQEPHLDPARARALYRIFQEATANVVRHAKARRVDIRLETLPDRIVLRIEDDGRGISEEDRKKTSLGLLGMTERALVVGGTVEVTGEPGKGTRVVASIPVAA